MSLFDTVGSLFPSTENLSGLSSSLTNNLANRANNALGGTLGNIAGSAITSVGNLMTTEQQGGGDGDPNSPTLNYLVVIRQEPTSIFTDIRTIKAHIPEEFSIDSRADFDTPFADSLMPDRRIGLALQIAGWAPTVQEMTAQFWKGSHPLDISLNLTLTAWSGPSDITDALFKLKSMVMPTVDPTTGFLKAPGPQLKFNKDAFAKLASDGKTLLSEAPEALKDVTPSATVVGSLTATGATLGAVSGGLPGSVIGGLAGAAIGVISGIVSTVKSAVSNSTGSITAKAKDVAAVPITAAENKVALAAINVGKDLKNLVTVTGKISIYIGKMLYFEDVVITGVSEQYNTILAPDGRPHKCSVTVTAVTRLTPTYENMASIYRATDPLNKGVIGDIKANL